MPKSDCWPSCCFLKTTKYQTLLEVASGSHTVSFCSFQLTVALDFETSTQRPCLCTKALATAASMALYWMVRSQSFISLQRKAQLNPHVCAYKYFWYVSLYGTPMPFLRVGNDTQPPALAGQVFVRRNRRCRGGRSAARPRQLLHRRRGDLPLPHVRVSPQVRDSRSYSGREIRQQRRGPAARPPWLRNGATVRAAAQTADRSPPCQRSQGGRRLEETPPAFIACTPPGCAGCRRLGRGSAFSGGQ